MRLSRPAGPGGKGAKVRSVQLLYCLQGQAGSPDMPPALQQYHK